MNKWQFILNMAYLWPALLGGIGVAIVTGPLGSIMVWRRLAYFGDTLSHSGLLGVTLALTFQINTTLGVCLIALMVALLLLGLQKHFRVSTDTLLGLLSHTTLALGLLALAFLPQIRVDVLGLLYGDILAITWQDIGLIYLGGLIVLFILWRLWSPLLRLTVDQELAQAEGVSVKSVQAGYVFLLALVVAIAIKIVGVLLITALLVVPAASARPLAKTPEGMASLASFFGVLSVVLGIYFSHYWDVPTGPAIVVTSAGFLLLTAILYSNKNKS